MSNLTNNSAAYLTQFNTGLNLYFLIVTSSVGIPCNLVSIVVFAMLMKNKTNMGFLYTIQCLVDLFLILISLLFLRATSINLTTVGFDSLSDPMCRFFKFIRRYPVHLSAWMPVLITFDRFIFIFYGNLDKFKFMKKKLNLTIIIIVMFLVIAIVDIPNLMYYLPDRKIYPNGTLGPATVCTATFPVIFSSDMLSIFFRTYIPLSLMLFLNILMIRKIFNKSRAAINQTSLSRKEYQFTFAAMSFDAYFFCMNFPFSVFYVIYDINFYNGAFSGEFGALYSLLYTIFFNISFFEQSFSFFMYLAFNKLFREKILNFSTSRFYRRSTIRIQPTSNHQQQNNSVYTT